MVCCILGIILQTVLRTALAEQGRYQASGVGYRFGISIWCCGSPVCLPLTQIEGYKRVARAGPYQEIYFLSTWLVGLAAPQVEVGDPFVTPPSPGTAGPDFLDAPPATPLVWDEPNPSMGLCAVCELDYVFGAGGSCHGLRCGWCAGCSGLTVTGRW